MRIWWMINAIVWSLCAIGNFWMAYMLHNIVAFCLAVGCVGAAWVSAALASGELP